MQLFIYGSTVFCVKNNKIAKPNTVRNVGFNPRYKIKYITLK
jgi:hypothetical protein